MTYTGAVNFNRLRYRYQFGFFVVVVPYLTITLVFATGFRAVSPEDWRVSDKVAFVVFSCVMIAKLYVKMVQWLPSLPLGIYTGMTPFHLCSEERTWGGPSPPGGHTRTPKPH